MNSCNSLMFKESMCLCFWLHSTACVTGSPKKCVMMSSFTYPQSVFFLLQNTKWKSVGSKPTIGPIWLSLCGQTKKTYVKILYCLFQRRKDVEMKWGWTILICGWNIYLIFAFSVFIWHVTCSGERSETKIQSIACSNCCGLLRERH